EAFHLRDLTVFHDEQLLLIEGGSQELVSHGGDGRLRGPETQELVQVEAESKNHGQDNREKDEEDLEFREPEPLEEIAQDQGEDADERKDREDDPEDTHAQVPAVQPLRGSDLLTLGGHGGASTTTSRGEGYFPRSVGAQGDLGRGYRIRTSACTACSRVESSPSGPGPPARSSRPRALASGF